MSYRAPTRTGESGFIALITAIIISAILLAVAVAMNQVGYLTRGEVLDSEYKDRSASLAEGCADTALLKLASDPSYAGNEAVTIGGETCKIRQLDPSVNPITIETRATFRDAATNLRVVVSAGDLSVISWGEVAAF